MLSHWSRQVASRFIKIVHGLAGTVNSRAPQGVLRKIQVEAKTMTAMTATTVSKPRTKVICFHASFPLAS
jgi:hypothetical protein